MYDKIIFDFCSDVIIFVDLYSNILRFNKQAELVFKILEKQIIGLNFFEVMKDNGIALCFSPQSLNSIENDKTHCFEGDILLFHPIQQKHTIHWTINKYSAENPQKDLFILIGKDISEAASYNASQNSRIYLNNIIENLPQYVYWKDKNLVYQGCNNLVAKYLGLNSSLDIIGKTDNDFNWDKTRVNFLHKIDEIILQKGITKVVEDAIPKEDGSTRIMLTSKAPLRNDNNEIIGVLGISFDITERKNMEKELHQAKIAAEAASHAKSEFIANISHDTRSPLTGIITFSRYLKEQDELSVAERKELAGDTYHASEQLLNLLNGVLDVVSADSATDNDLNLKSFSLLQMIEELIQLEKPAVKSHQLELRQSIDKNIPKFIVSDKMKLHRILLNLIGNSIKFTEKGYIKLSATLQSKNEKEATVVFSVEDTGIGIPEEAQPQIFERFYKVNPSYKGKYTGNGIGLHIVQTYLRLLGGKIDFHSTFGKGTTFIVTFTFPIGEAPTEEDEDSSYKDMLKQEQDNILLKEQRPALETTAITTTDSIDSTIKILVVEDFLPALKSLRVLFMPYQLPIVEAQSAEEALELVKKEAFDLIITDIGLPKMQGDELIAKIRQLEKETGRARGKIVALTGHAVDGELGDKCKEAGVDALFEKPMRPMFLKSLLDPLIKKEPKETKPVLKPKAEVTLKDKSSPSREGKLGPDLPDTEEQLFEIDHHPLLDLSVGESLLGSKEATKELLKTLKTEGIDPDLEILKEAHTLGDWETVRALTHKIKGGSTLGTVRLYYALLYLERYLKAGHTRCAEELYAQMLQVIDETVDYLAKHL